tara:strand:- start:8795 stop:9187 length:393 start_codon:yes stop_codon:yes gene_type:complete
MKSITIRGPNNSIRRSWDGSWKGPDYTNENPEQLEIRKNVPMPNDGNRRKKRIFSNGPKKDVGWHRLAAKMEVGDMVVLYSEIEISRLRTALNQIYAKHPFTISLCSRADYDNPRKRGWKVWWSGYNIHS